MGVRSVQSGAHPFVLWTSSGGIVSEPGIAFTSYTPASGVTGGGSVATLTGSGFVGPVSVTFGPYSSNTKAVVNNSTVTCTVPAASASGATTITITQASKSASLSNFTYFGVPTLTGLSPTSGTTTAGTVLTLTGTQFVPSSTTVTVGAANATGVVVTAFSSLTCAAPSSTTTGAVAIVVTTPSGSVTSTDVFTYTAGLVLSGTSFGTKTTPAPAFFSTFEGTTVGTPCTDASVGLVQIPGGSGVGSVATVGSTRVHSGTRSLTQLYSADYFPVIGVTFSGSQYIYAGQWMYIESVGGSDTGNQLVKLCRGGAGGTYSGKPQFYDTAFPDIADAGYNDGLNPHQVSQEDGTRTWGRWHWMEHIYKLSTPGAADGCFLMWCDGQTTSINTQTAITRTTGISDLADHVVMAFDGCQPAGLTVAISVDELLLDNSLARVIATDAATYANSTRFAPQAPTTWSNTQITIANPNWSNLTTGTTAYFHVFDSNNTHVTAIAQTVP